ncbi:hypothetical protein BCR43DRAFT_564483 [Syncephalastrum racemosum]|uniref:P-loop containing nucleoside triphosphate hydrolase protein n=1 Tax=Syncephalastrum racemosum TaxID=13706 RepID=A0A1X2HAH8_SYNRA|nr:hypothetical protein BCR43DRAFT_564483 [Syncephalastrum racemosum]
MAPLKIIGAGYGRTGTDSLKEALNRLGYKTHHMNVMDAPGRHPELFVEQISHPEHDNWDTIYEGFDAAVDWPTVAFIEPLMKKYPDAKIILTERDADAWIKSMNNTILAPFRHPSSEIRKANEAKLKPEELARLYLTDKVVLGGIRTRSANEITDEKVKALFLEHNAKIKAIVPKEKLLVMDTKEMNWETLCAFLGISDVPNEPFPHVNSSAEAQAHFEDLPSYVIQ